MGDFEAIQKILTLEAVSGGLTWDSSLAALKESSSALDALKPFGRHSSATELLGMYRGCEDFCAVYGAGEHSGLQFLWSAIDYVAREADQVGTGDVSNASGFAYRYGPDGVAALLLVLQNSAPFTSAQWRRAETEAEDGTVITAPVGTDDQRFEEASFVRCELTDEHATLITVMDVDEEAFAALTDLIEAKDAAARRAYRAPPPAQSASERTS